MYQGFELVNNEWVLRFTIFDVVNLEDSKQGLLDSVSGDESKVRFVFSRIESV